MLDETRFVENEKYLGYCANYVTLACYLRRVFVPVRAGRILMVCKS